MDYIRLDRWIERKNTEKQIKGPDNPTCVAICARKAGESDERKEEICVMSVV